MSTFEWQATYEHMIAEWQSIRDCGRSRRVARWVETFEQYVADQRTLRDGGLWYSGPTDLLSIIGRSRRETFHCAILAWLMDPGAPHGLGTRFLAAVLNACFPDVTWDSEPLDGTVTECEVVRPRSCADIVLWIADLAIVFEAKVDHVEREGQCDDLYFDFSSEPRARFVFLTPRGREPESATGEARLAFHPLSFRTVVDTLRHIKDDASIDANRWPGLFSIESYLQTLEAEFS